LFEAVRKKYFPISFYLLKNTTKFYFNMKTISSQTLEIILQLNFTKAL